MIYKAIKVKQGKMGEPIESGVIQPDDCLLVQINGLATCLYCTVKDTPDCGGGETLKQIKEQVNS